jgi:hypothetical protein
MVNFIQTHLWYEPHRDQFGYPGFSKPIIPRDPRNRPESYF